jgi:geranylgeranyl reductase family protein
MEKTDIIIVGGGPAGSTCARALTQAGFDVTIIDKKSFPRDKICAGWITPAVVETLEIDLKDYAKENTLQELSGFITGMIGEKTALVDYGKAMSYGIRRCEFDHYLLKRSGAKLVENEAVKKAEYIDGQWVINDKFSAPLLIGAGGHFCPVARITGAKLGHKEPIVAAQEVEFEMTDDQAKDCIVEATVPELYFCRDLIGYGWIFRKDNFLNIGLGRQDNHKLSEHVDTFVRDLQEAGRIPKNITKKMQGHAYLLYGDAPRDLVGDGVLLIGDSAGLAYAQSGEGIRPAIESSLMAAETIKACAGSYSKAALQDYVMQIEHRFGPRDKRTNISVASILPDQLKRFFAAKLLGNKSFAKNYVLNKWFFHLEKEPMHFQHDNLVPAQAK